MRDVEAPRQQLHERGTRGGRDRLRLVVADHRDSGAPGVEPLSVSADDVLRDSPASALEDLAVLVDEEVVTDVVPAVREHVIALDASHDRRRFRC